MIEFSSLSCGYSGKNILKNISGAIEHGCLTSLIGPNGSGKSTMIRILAGFGSYEGSLSLNGREVRSIKRREFGQLLGLVPQQINIAAAFSVYDVIALGRLPYHDLFSRLSTDDEKIILEAAERTGISHLLCRCATELSGGERQRVLFSMVLAQNPDVYLLDEPTSALDPNQSIRIFTILRELADAGKTVVVAAHDINMSIPYSDRYISLQEGKITSEGEASDVDQSVLNPLYKTSFVPYTSDGGDIAWHPQRSFF